MPSCAVKWCQSRTGKHNKQDGLTYHIFPSNPNVKDMWTAAVRLERNDPTWLPSKSTKICSIHFVEDDIYVTNKGNTNIKKDAIPICTMVRSKKQVRKIGCHSEDAMRTAIELIKSGLSLRQASKQCNLSYTTVRRYAISSKMSDGKTIRLTPNYEVNRVFSTEEEAELVKYIKKGNENEATSERYSSRDCRRLAYEMAKIINKKIPTRWINDEMAGMDWIKSFKDRHKISLVKRKAGEIMRQIVFDKDDMEAFFGHLKIIKEEVREQPAPAHPVPGPSNVPRTKNSSTNASSNEEDPLSKGTIEQCRFCGEFSKECVSVSGMPYVSTNRTTLAFNDVIVQIDFNDQTLPKTICKDCDAKIQDMFDFVRVVKNAQRSLINVAEQEKVEINVEVDPSALETVVVKTEYEDSDDEKGDSSHDGNEDNDSNDDDDNDGEDNDDCNEEDDNKDGIVDSVTVSETIFIKEPVALKRKNITNAKNSKKAKVTESKSEENKTLIIDIKEEVIEKDTNDDDNNTGYSDTGTDEKPTEVELATSALVFEMRGDSAGGFS